MSGQIKETPTKKSGRVRSGRAGGKARAKTLIEDERREIAKRAATACWGAD